ncbi:MAG: hypothetical protein KF847_02630 [Pirellulales bacterium]|nr:hypothetical protein [Pirellulales bacterium]
MTWSRDQWNLRCRSALRCARQAASCGLVAAFLATLGLSARCDAADYRPAASQEELLERFESGSPERTLSDSAGANSRSSLLSGEAAKFDQWQPILGEDESSLHWDETIWRPMDRIRHWGFRHSSTHGRHVGRGLPLERSSWMNRPFHVDWFAGPMLGSELSPGVKQSSDILAGLRVGWDFDYYWGLDWRIGWASPRLSQLEDSGNQIEGSYMVSDVSVVYYPWGDSKVRPYLTLGMGVVQLESYRLDTSLTEDVTLLGMPFGAGIRFLQTPWLSWRLEMMQNLAFGGSGVNTIDNVSFNAGMEWRLGAKPNSYWPWRTSRTMW